MTPTLSERDRRRMESDREELSERIARSRPRDGSAEVRPGLFFNRISSPDYAVHGVLEPSCCVVAEGSKEVSLGGEEFRYDAAHYLIATMGVPAVAKIVEATPQRPYLSVRFVLDPAVVTSVMVESGMVQPQGNGGGGEVRAVDVSALDAGLLDATLRLVRLAESADEYRMLGPLVMRELVYRLLTGAQAARLRHLARFGGHDHRMVRAVKTLTDNFSKPLRVEDVAHEVGMSVSGFHAHFKSVTNMSPLQFQKHLRLQEARRLMLSENLDAGEAGFRVGYEDQSYFSRDYKRHFGEPPGRDVERLRELATA